MGKGKLSDEFDISVAKELPYGDAQDVRLALKPRSRSRHTRPSIWSSTPKTYLVRQSVLINTQGDINAISFSEVKINTKLADSQFKWTAPAGTRVIEAAKPTK